MLTVTLGLEESGKSRTWSPLGRAYSVMPSTAVIFRTPCGRVWENAVNAKVRTSGSNALLRFIVRYLRRPIGRFRQIITGDVWGEFRVARAGVAVNTRNTTGWRNVAFTIRYGGRGLRVFAGRIRPPVIRLEPTK